MACFKIVAVVCILGACLVEAAPRSKSKTSLPQTVYDQKQTGDYNIQLHLKDFQIIALLADDSIGGDYDYNYDYSDFTVKPSGSTTSKPNVTIEPADNQTTVKPNNHPYPILLPLTTEKPLVEINPSPPTKIEEKPSSTEKLEMILSSTPVAEAEMSQPGKIKVQILEAPVSTPPHVGIVPGEDLGDVNDSLALGDTPLRRCSSGYSRDKKGRCRKVRRPGPGPLPFGGISRLATNLAAKFRYASPDNSNTNIE
ncbi:unnamed protein product [Brassicogethes aeneus]|uniref:Uncharacterized protein n=1 Tax=Brassicogethes aeneus TaxID=1431903 RepID=A0A9P0FFT4_BRAAE|nr:unnamed protein product [Brassicogethes aeneus]